MIGNFEKRANESSQIDIQKEKGLYKKKNSNSNLLDKKSCPRKKKEVENILRYN